MNKTKELIFAYDAYINLLGEEIDSLVKFSHTHGYKGNEETYLKGMELREKIDKIKKKNC
jgi:hypothetical protein